MSVSPIRQFDLAPLLQITLRQDAPVANAIGGLYPLAGITAGEFSMHILNTVTQVSVVGAGTFAIASVPLSLITYQLSSPDTNFIGDFLFTPVLTVAGLPLSFDPLPVTINAR